MKYFLVLAGNVHKPSVAQRAVENVVDIVPQFATIF